MNERQNQARAASGPARFAAVTLAALSVAAAFALGPSCLERRTTSSDDSNETRCATCHGDPTRDGDWLLRSAPPRDLLGASTPGYPGVGAHALHLSAGETHAAVACTECHRVPEQTDSPGHADDARPAELVFGSLASSGGREPRYNALARSCSESWCHGERSDAVWTEPRSSAAACGSCHGLPPALPHPQSELCHACHGEVIDAAGQFVEPALHVDGRVQAGPGACNGVCHGSEADPAPPKDTLGQSASSALGVGAHRAHLTGGTSSRALACGECHVVPATADAAGHADGLPAQVRLLGIAATRERKPSWDHETASCAESWCHGPTADEARAPPSWVAVGALDCTSCHGAPPPAPHPQISDCARCHAEVVGADNRTIILPTRHVDGVVDVAIDPSCSSCHGSENPAPPLAVNGESASTFPGVGAHQSHLGAGARARAVACSECHAVPEEPLASGHIDTGLPAEVEFAGVAKAFGAEPSYEAGSCRDTACHGGVFPDGDSSGGSNIMPSWAEGDGTPSGCGSCHGMPPPRPHPYPTDCSQCHENVAQDNLSFLRPELHVDGEVTFTLP